RPSILVSLIAYWSRFDCIKFGQRSIRGMIRFHTSVYRGTKWRGDIMLNIGYFKAHTNEYIIKYTSGRVVREGKGLAFFYWKHNTQIVAVPTTSVDANLVFNEVTRNFQAVTIQGQLTYRISDPNRAAELLNFTVDPESHQHISEDPDRLAQRITNVI